MSQTIAKNSNKVSDENGLTRFQRIGSPLRLAGWLMGTLPTLFVLAALAGIATFGHYSGWKIPPLSGLTPTSSEVDEWCPEHSVPESECVECIPTLLPAATDFGWCQEHGVHQCPHCHPEIAQLKETPQVSRLQNSSISLALSTKDRQENNLGCGLYRSRVQFASIEAVRKAGIDVELAETRPLLESITANGEITYDETRIAHVSTRADGIAWRVDRTTGDQVRKGDLLALVDSAVVGDAKATLLDAVAQVDYQSKTVSRLAPLANSQAISGARLLEEETLLQQAQIQMSRAAQTLANLGMSVDVEQVRRLPEQERWEAVRFSGIPDSYHAQLAVSTATNNLIPVVATIDGVITERHVVQGEVVSTSRMLFQIVDTSVVWLRFRVALENAAHLQLGQAVQFRPDGARQDLSGMISWISTNVDKSTRTVEVRCEVPNQDGALRNEVFGTGEIILREAPEAVVVPSEAVQWDGSCFVVFVRDKNYFAKDHPKLFHTRSVRPGVTKDGHTEIIAGLLPGEVVATQGSSVLRSQILKNNLGAGCTCGQ